MSGGKIDFSKLDRGQGDKLAHLGERVMVWLMFSTFILTPTFVLHFVTFQVKFILPDGKTSEEEFRAGMTVGYLKTQIERRHSILYQTQAEQLLPG